MKNKFTFFEFFKKILEFLRTFTAWNDNFFIHALQITARDALGQGKNRQYLQFRRN